MEFFIDEEDTEEVKPVPDTADQAVYVTPKPIIEPNRSRTDFEKESISLDAIGMGSTDASKIHGVPVGSAQNYKNLEGLNEDSRLRVLSIVHKIQDVAVTKLMDTLELIDPEEYEKPRDKIALITGLGSLLEKTTQKNDNKGVNVKFEIHVPEQSKETQFKIIDVAS